MPDNRFTTKFEVDEYGDVFLEFPDDLIEALGWKPGDTIEIDAIAGRVCFTKVED
jgi:hypothetical protein